METDTRTTLPYLWSLLQVPGVGHKTLRELIEKAGGVAALWEAPVSFLKTHLSEKKAMAVEAVRQRGLQEIPELYARTGVQVISYDSEDYPPLLRETYDPPLLLFARGNLDALTSKTLAVVGTRRMSEYGRQVTEKLVADLRPSGACIVSGLAAGVDACAHWAAIRNGLPTVAVFGCGLDIYFPVNHDKLAAEILAHGGALISEYPLGTHGNKYTYPQRNRIVAGLSHGVVVVEGPMKSGALITARLASEEGRNVYAVPGNIFSPGAQGPLNLIKTGATPITGGEDMLRDLQWWQGEPDTANARQTTLFEAASADLGELSEAERKILNLISFDPVAVETVQQQAGLPSAQVNELLTLLELNGLVITLPGAKVSRT